MSSLQNENPAEKSTDIATTIGEQVAQLCQCQYSETFISNGQFFCGNSKKQVIYQAQLLITDGKTAEEIRNITQKWVLTKPFITISGKSYQLDPYCSVVIKEFGDITCDAVSPTQLESSVVGLFCCSRSIATVGNYWSGNPDALLHNETKI